MGFDVFHARWSPAWLKRLFPGRWTQEEVDAIQRRAREHLESLERFIDDGPGGESGGGSSSTPPSAP